jgi:hypothetical protein
MSRKVDLEDDGHREFDYIGCADAGRILGYTRGHIFLLIKAGRIPAIRTSLGHIMNRSVVEALAKDWVYPRPGRKCPLCKGEGS